MNMHRKTFLRGTGALALAAALPTLARSEAAWPAHVVRMILPWPAGGPPDVMIRPVLEKLSVALGQPVILESRAGAGGTIGTAYVAKSAPDGYTVLISHIGPMAINPHMRGFQGYDPLKDFLPVTQLTSTSLVLVVREDLPVKDVREFIAYSKTRQLNFGSVGPGSTTHLAGEMMRSRGGYDFVHVPYKGTGPLVTDMLAGRIDYSLLSMNAVEGFIKTGKLRALAMTSLKPSTLYPQLPTVSEVLPGFEFDSWFGVHVPAGTPRPIVDRLYREIVQILKQPDIAEKIRQTGFEPVGSTPEELDARLRADYEHWGVIVKAARLSMD